MAKILGNDIVTTEEMVGIKEKIDGEINELGYAVKAVSELMSTRDRTLTQDLLIQKILASAGLIAGLAALAVSLMR